MRRLAVLVIAALTAATPAAAQTAPTVPAGFTIETIAHVPRARELAVTPNGDLLVGTLGNHIAIVPDAQGTAGEPRTFATFEDRPVAGVAVRDAYVYAGGQFGVYRIPYRAGQREGGKPEKIASLRTNGVSRDHVTTTVATIGDRLYASVGSSCNACDPELDATRATVQEMGLDGRGIHPRAVDIRNAIALAVSPHGDLWAGVAGRDELPDGHPYEIFDDISAHPGTPDYGWLKCYDDRRPIGGASCDGVVTPRVVFPAYTTPIGATFYAPPSGARHAFPAEYAGGAFVTLHGSWHTPLRAPRVAFVPMNGDHPKTAVDWADPNKQWREFLGGCQNADATRSCRVTGIAVGTDGSLFVSDDAGGAIYRIRPR